MKIIKIGRYWYKEISEEEYCRIWDEANDRTILAVLLDYEGEPIKYFEKQNREK